MCLPVMCLPAWSIVILLLIFLNSKAYGSSEPQLEFADYLFENQNFYQAITEYKRFIFHHPESQPLNLVYYKIGLCYKHGKKYNLARDSFEMVLDNQPDDSLKKMTGLALAQTYVDEENLEAARFELDELPPDSEIHYWKGITYLHEYKWKLAQIEFNQVTEGEWLDTTRELSTCIEQALHLSYLSEKHALRLSTFIPGTGQIYAGKILDGIISFAFNASMVYFISERVKADDFIGSGLIFSIGLMRFYQGNKVNAYQAAQKYNEQLNSQTLEKMRKRD